MKPVINRIALGTPDNPVFGDIRIGHDIGRDGHSYIWNSCTGCGKGEWKVIIKGKPDNVMCISCNAKERYKNPEAREMTRQSQIKRYQNPEERLKTSESVKKSYTPELLESRKIIFNKLHTETDIDIKQSERLKERWRDPNYRAKMKKMAKDKWVDPIIKENRVRTSRLSSYIRPNKLEKLIDSILNDLYPNEWKYVGDGNFVINGYCPDFVNINGQKKIIEVFGDYWHNKSDIGWSRTELGRIMCFNSFGYDTLILWEHDIKEWTVEKLKNEIRKFNNKKHKVLNK